MVKRRGKELENLYRCLSWTTWMAGTSPAMTASIDSVIPGRRLSLDDASAIKSIPLRNVATEGDTAAQLLGDRHRDVADIDLGATHELARDVANAVKGTQTRRWTRAEVLKILKIAAAETRST